MISKKNLPLYIALAVPVLMILLVAAFIYLPGIGKKPAHNFVYMSGQDVYYYGDARGEYTVTNGRLVKNPLPPIPEGQAPYYKPAVSDPHFYFYDVSKHEAREITLAEAAAFELDPSNVSPDGYTVERGNGNSGAFLFGDSGDYNSWFLKGHNRANKLNIKLIGTDYYNMRFLGWVK